jgi:hypothetical protein
VKRRLLSAFASAALGWLSASAAAQEPHPNPAQSVRVVESEAGAVKPPGPLGPVPPARDIPFAGETDSDNGAGLAKGMPARRSSSTSWDAAGSDNGAGLGKGMPAGTDPAPPIHPAPAFGNLFEPPAVPGHNDFHDPGCAAPGGGFSAGVGIYVLRPFFSNNPATTTTGSSFSSGGPPFVSTSAATTRDFRYDYTVSPRLWLGYSGASGLGARLSWWRFDQTAQADTFHQNPDFAHFTTIQAGGLSSSPPGFGNITDFLAVKNRLFLDVWDFDLTQRWQGQNGWLLGGGGVRYLHISQSYNASLTQTASPFGSNFGGAFHASNNFDGAGPTLFLEGHRRVGGSGLGVYASARGAVLFGSGHQTSLTLNQFSGTGFSFSSVSIIQGSHDPVLPVVEGELGVEWSRQRGNYNPFLRLGVVGMNYFNVGSATAAGTSTFGTFGGSNGTANSNLGFLGVTITTGISF